MKPLAKYDIITFILLFSWAFIFLFFVPFDEIISIDSFIKMTVYFIGLDVITYLDKKMKK